MNPDKKPCRWQTVLKILVIVLLLACFSGGFVILVKSGYMEIILKWIGDLGFWGNAMLVGLFIPVCYPWALGYGVIALCCGFLYGYLWGWITVIIGTNLGNIVVFLTLRSCFTNSIRRFIQKKQKLRVLLIALERHTIKFGILLRYTPLPIGVQNALFAISHISFWHYLWISFVNTLPEEFMWTYAGRNARNIADVVKGHLELGKWTYLIFAIDLVVLITIVVIVVIVGRKALKRAEEEAQLHEALIKHANEEKIHPNDPQKSLIYWDIIENHRSLTFQKNDSSVASVPNINDDDKIYIDTERLLTISRFPPLDQNSVSDLLETADNNDKHFDVI